MTDQISVVDFDGDEAVAEAIAGIEEEKSTRFGLLKSVGVFAGAAGAATLLRPGIASARNGGSKKNDIKILNYALTLEYLEAAFYNEALRVGGYSGAVGRFASVVAGHENTHVATLKGVLGSRPSRARTSTSRARRASGARSCAPPRCSRTRAWPPTRARPR